MKIVYFAEWDFSIPSGVQAKIEEQVLCWRQLGHEVYLLIVSPNQKGETQPLKGKQIFNSAISRLFTGGFRSYANKILCSRKIKREISRIEPDIIYYRLGIWHPGLNYILKDAPYVVEINSRDLLELKRESILKSVLHKIGRSKFLRNAIGICPISFEISESLKSYNKPMLIIGNGAIFKNRTIEKNKLSSRPQALFVGSKNQTWHGVDLLIKIAANLSEIDFHIVGPELNHNSPKNVFFYGSIFGAELDNLANRMDIGIGSLGLFRNQMAEASPLKTRQYAAWGLPFIYAYKDTDIADQPEFVLELEPNEEKILSSINEIRNFAHKHLGKPHDSSRFQKYFDRKQKEIRRLTFFKTLKSENMAHGN